MTRKTNRSLVSTAWSLLAVFLFGVLPLVRADLPVRAIRFEGEWPLPERRARALVNWPLGAVFDPTAAQAAADRLMEACRTAYHPFARVRWRALPDESHEQLTLMFSAETGLRGRVERIAFQGNSAMTHAGLLEVVQVKPRSGPLTRMTGRDVLLVEQLADDQVALLSHYRAAGYRDAEIGVPEVKWSEELMGFDLIWPILHEGPRYRIGHVLGSPIAVEAVQSWEGAWASPDALDAIEAGAARAYLKKGHAFVSVEMEEEWSPDSGHVDIALQVDPGPVSTLRQTRITGLTRTQERVVRREVRWQPGDPFDPDLLSAGWSSVLMTELFEDVALDYYPVNDGREFDVELSLREKRTGRVEMGVIWGSVEGAALQAVLRELNFAPWPPFRGRAYQAHAGATVGSRIRRVESGLLNPRIGGTRWSLGGNVFIEDNEFVSALYDQRSMAGTLMATHPVGRYQVIGVGVSGTGFQLRNIDSDFGESLSPEDRKLDLFALLATWSAQRVDRSFRPTRGFRLQQDARYGVRSMGGDVEIFEWEARAAFYVNPVHDHVIAVRAETGHIEAMESTESVPLPLRKFLGGPGNLRGFAYRTISPLSEAGEALGGASYWWTGIEYLYPVGSRLDLALYTAVGEVGERAWRFSGDGPVSDWGMGVVVRAENFPVRFDVAFPVDVLEGDRKNRKGGTRWSFSAGYMF